MRLRTVLVVIPALVAVFLLAGGASANVTLALTGYSNMVVDPGHGHVFVTGAPSDSAIAVLNTDGTSAGKITGESGAGGMALSADGGTLYVARCGAGMIDEIDTATLTKTGSFASTVGGTCDLALAGGRLWYSNSTDGQFGHLVSISLDSSHTEIDTGINLYGMIFTTTPVHPNWLIVGESGVGPAAIRVEDVTDPSNVTLAGSTTVDGVDDFAVTSDGATLLVAVGGVSSFSLPDLTAGTVYPTDAYPTAVAASPTGTKLVGGSKSFYDKDVWVFNPGTTTATVRYDFNSTDIFPYPRGLAFSPDGTKIYAVTTTAAGAPVFRVLSTVPLLKGSVSIKRSKATITNGQAVTLTAHLGTSSSVKTVSIYRKPAAGGTAVLAHTGKVGASGNLTYVVHPNQNTIYTVRWAGDATHSPATSAGGRVNVHLVMHAGFQGGYKTASGVRLYHYTSACSKAAHKGCPLFLAYAAPLQKGRKISYVVQARVGTGAWHVVLKGSGTPAAGKMLLTVYYTSPAFIGLNQRIHFSTPSNPSVLGGTSAWRPFRITN